MVGEKLNTTRTLDEFMQAGIRQLGLGQPKEAEILFRQALFRKVGFPPAMEALGISLEQQGREKEAIETYRRVLAIAPKSVVARFQIAKLLAARDRWQDAVTELRKLLEYAPNLLEARLILAQGLVQLEQDIAAESELRRCIKQDSKSSEAHSMLGYRLQATGRFGEAREHFRRSIAIEPNQSVSYHGIFQGAKASEDDRSLLESMAIAVDSGTLSDPDKMYLIYTIAKCYEDLGEYELAAQRYIDANRMAQIHCLRGRVFNREAYTAEITEAISHFDQGTFGQLVGVGSNDQTPIFIVGMMRSGTTLVEQILCCHPNVAGGGEREFWLKEGRHLVNPSEIRKQAPQLAKDYLKSLEQVQSGHQRVTDKMPQNFQLLGLIHTIFPLAPIIHVRRDPIDTCLSIYTAPYQKSPDFAHDPETIVFAYQQYLRVMEHWRKVLPNSQFLEVDYEDLVQNRESVTRRIVEFCGLDWSDACLHHESNPRVVATPSVWQVRQPIYKSSINRAQNFLPWLPEFGVLEKV
jgi:tetratricopeptide (TPR) repeat protein